MNKPSTDLQAVAEYYNDYSESYDSERRKGYYSFINDLEFEKIQSLAAGSKVLEVGCGTGLILERTDAIGAEVYGVDLSPKMVEICRKKGLNAQEASVTALPFEDDSFDLVYSFKVLAHVPDIRKAMSEIVRVTRPGGRMVLEFYNPVSFKGLTDWLRTLIRGYQPVYIRHDTVREIQKYLPDGISVVSMRGIRIFAFFSGCYTLPLVSRVFRFLDRLVCDGPLRRFGGYLVVELLKKGGP